MAQQFLREVAQFVDWGLTVYVSKLILTFSTPHIGHSLFFTRLDCHSNAKPSEKDHDLPGIRTRDIWISSQHTQPLNHLGRLNNIRSRNWQKNPAWFCKPELGLRYKKGAIKVSLQKIIKFYLHLFCLFVLQPAKIIDMNWRLKCCLILISQVFSFHILSLTCLLLSITFALDFWKSYYDFNVNFYRFYDVLYTYSRISAWSWSILDPIVQWLWLLTATVLGSDPGKARFFFVDIWGLRTHELFRNLRKSNKSQLKISLGF
jgi:hypothetical protein